MTDRITIPLVAYTALAAQLDEAQATLDRTRKALAATKVYQAALDAETTRDRLQAQIDRFAPEERQDARSEGPAASVDHTQAGSGGAREPATIDRDDPGPIPDCLDVTKRGRE